MRVLSPTRFPALHGSRCSAAKASHAELSCLSEWLNNSLNIPLYAMESSSICQLARIIIWKKSKTDRSFWWHSDSGESLGMPHLSPFMKPLGSNFSNGVNFAIAGSTAMPGVTTFSLDVQVDQFVFFKERCLDSIERGLVCSALLFFLSNNRHLFFWLPWTLHLLLKLTNEKKTNVVWFSYLTGLAHLLPGESAPIVEKAFPDAIYTMDIGHNDINGVLHLPYHTMLENLPPVIAEIKKAIEVNVIHRSDVHCFYKP